MSPKGLFTFLYRLLPELVSLVIYNIYTVNDVSGNLVAYQKCIFLTECVLYAII